MSEYIPTPEQLDPADVRFLPESELIEITANIETALTPLGEAAFDEYMKRRGEVINNAIASRQRGDL
jgi:hypothetical protein